MKDILIYTLILAVITFVLLVKKKPPLGIFLFLIYMIIGFISVYAINMNSIPSYLLYNNTIWPYLLLICSYLLFFSPFYKNNDFRAEKISIEIDRRYVVFLICFIIFSIISILVYLPYIKPLLASGNWSYNRELVYSGEVSIPYTNFFEKIAMVLADYLDIPALLVAFIFLCKNEKKFIAISTILLVTSNTFLTSLYLSSRGLIFNFFVLLIGITIFFWKKLGKKDRRKIILIFFVVGFIASVYAISVTISRFSGGVSSVNSSSQNSLFYYFGQAPIVFNYGVNNLDTFMHGQYSLGKFFELFGITDMYNPSYLMYDWSIKFYTFFGLLYIDWGTLGLIVIGILFTILLGKKTKKSEIGLSDLFLVFYFYSILLRGVFVIGRTFSVEILYTLIVYIAIKIIFEKVSYAR